MTSTLILSLVLGYLIGSIPFPFITAKLVKGIDLREVGSKNVGARNTANNLGLGWGIFAGVLDALKGVAAIYAAQTALGLAYPDHLWAGLAAMAGHNWPVWLNFRGGKGLATAFGVGLWIAPQESVVGFVVTMALINLTKNMFISTIAGYGLAIAMAITWMQRPAEAITVLVGTFLLVAAASLPNAIEVFKKPGGVKDYFERPNQAYEDDPSE